MSKSLARQFSLLAHFWVRKQIGQALAPTALTKEVYLREDKLRRKGMAAVDDGVAGLTRLA